MRNVRRDVRRMTVEELRREKVLRRAWIRDVSGLNRARMAKIDQELGRRESGAVCADKREVFEA